MTKEKATELIKIYGKAWESRDADLILSIFTPEATYFEPHEGTQVGHAGIKAYWESKVVGTQKDISFKLLNVWIDGDVVIAEWNAVFTDTQRNLLIDMTEVAIFGVAGDKFSSSRECYRTIKKEL
jgi:ketosteroid isomerase-like protein